MNSSFLHPKSYLYTFFQKLNILHQSFPLPKIATSILPISSNALDDISFLAPEIKTYIEETYTHFHVFQYHHTTLRIAGKYSSKEAQYLFRIILLLQNFFEKSNCTLCVSYYPTPFRKELLNSSKPTPTSSKKSGLTPREVNSGVTFLEPREHQHKHNGEVVVFRKEEHLKVLIHELIHSFHLDYELVAHSRKTQRDLCTNYPILLNEAYTESLATLFYIYFSLPPFLFAATLFKSLFKKELKYELGMAKKILKLNGMNARDLSSIVKEDGSCKAHFYQHTNVFSYYLLKPLLLYHMDFFDLFMKKHTKNGKVKKSGVDVLEKFVFSILEDASGSFIQDIEKSQVNRSKSLKMCK